MNDSRRNVRIRRAEESDLEIVYEMIFEPGEGVSLEEHLSRCRSSRKLRSGDQWVLERDGALLSSLITYRFDHPPFAPAIGIANLNTFPDQRKQGHATTLLRGVLRELETGQGIEVFYLLSDIGTMFYERLGFRALPVSTSRHRADSVPMLRCRPEAWDTTVKNRAYLRDLMMFVD